MNTTLSAKLWISLYILTLVTLIQARSLCDICTCDDGDVFISCKGLNLTSIPPLGFLTLNQDTVLDMRNNNLTKEQVLKWLVLNDGSVGFMDLRNNADDGIWTIAMNTTFKTKVYADFPAYVNNPLCTESPPAPTALAKTIGGEDIGSLAMEISVPLSGFGLITSFTVIIRFTYCKKKARNERRDIEMGTLPTQVETHSSDEESTIFENKNLKR